MLLVEALIGIVLFAIGILGLVALQASTAKSMAEAKYRAQAGFLANQIIAAMWLDNTSLQKYEHFATSENCKSGGKSSELTADSSSAMSAWLAAVQKALPQASSSQQRISVKGSEVSVSICWKHPKATDWSHFDVTAYIVGA